MAKLSLAEVAASLALRVPELPAPLVAQVFPGGHLLPTCPGSHSPGDTYEFELSSLASELSCAYCSHRTLTLRMRSGPAASAAPLISSRRGSVERFLRDVHASALRLDRFAARSSTALAPRAHMDLLEDVQMLSAHLTWVSRRLGSLGFPDDALAPLLSECASLSTRLYRSRRSPSPQHLRALASQARSVLGILSPDAPLDAEEVFIAYASSGAVFPRSVVDTFSLASPHATVLRAPRFVEVLLTSKEGTARAQLVASAGVTPAEADLAAALFDPRSSEFSSFAFALSAARASLATL